jgi:WD40 repeat protein
MGRNRFILPISAALAVSCGQGEDLLPPLTGGLAIEVVTEGEPVDPDGYTVTIDQDEGVGIAASDTVVEAGLEPGEHRVALSGIADNCMVQVGNPLAVQVTAEDTARVEFRLSCTAEPVLGVLLATVSTSGALPDSDGYELAADPVPPTAAEPNDTIMVTELSAGDHLVRLLGVADRCSVSGENPRRVSVPPGDTARTDFAVTCRPPLSGRIAFVGFRSGESFISDLLVIMADGAGLIDLTRSFTDIAVSQPSFSLDGRHLAASRLGRRSDIVLVGSETDGTPSLRVIGHGDCPALSADGSRVAYQVIGDAIYVQDVDGGTPKAILREPDTGTLGCPAWSPDDSRVAVTAEFFPTDSPRIYLVPVAGGEPQILNLGPDDEFADAVSWSPLGDRLAFTMPWPERIESRDVFVMDLDGATTNLTAHRVPTAADPSWSPDGTRLVFGSDDGLFLINADGTGLARLTHDAGRVDRQPTWAPE